jgi:hypothetical protein
MLPNVTPLCGRALLGGDCRRLGLWGFLEFPRLKHSPHYEPTKPFMIDTQRSKATHDNHEQSDHPT